MTFCEMSATEILVPGDASETHTVCGSGDAPPVGCRGSRRPVMRRSWRIPAVAATILALVAGTACSSSTKTSKGPRAANSVPANEQAANGPLVGDSTLVSGEQSCARTEQNAPWYPTIAAFE